MRILTNIIGILFLLAGCVWFLQGINVIPGSFMTGQMKWTIYGGICIVIGIVLVLSANRKRT